MRAGLIIFAVLLQACSETNVYEGVRQNRLLECRQLPPGQYEDCMQQYSKGYGQYRERLDEVNQPAD